MRLLENVDRHIYAQGDLDGACFLYAIVNAYIALTGQEPDFYQVGAAFKAAPRPQNFLSGNPGTSEGFGEAGQLQLCIEGLLAGLGAERFRVEQATGDIFVELPTLVTAHSVALIHYKGDSLLRRGFNHWVTGVAGSAAGRVIHLACSVALQKSCFNRRCAYEEEFHPDYGRWSNDRLSDAHAYSIPVGGVFRVTLLD